MVKKFELFKYLIILLCLALPFMSLPVVSAQAISQNDIVSANTILKAFSELQAGNVAYEKSIIQNSSKIKSGQALKPYLNQLKSSVKNFYMTMYNFKPSQKFSHDHQELLKASYQNVQVINGSINVIDKGGTPQQFVSYISTHKASVAAKYEKAIKNVINVVESWPPDSNKAAMSGVRLLY